MLIMPDNCTLLGDGLDHPESVCVGPDGAVYAGSESGTVYRLTDAGQEAVGCNGGFLLGLTLDAAGRIYACDCGQQAVYRFAADESPTRISTGTADLPLENPNHSVFDADGNLYFTDSGDYWNRTGTGRVYRIDADGETTLFHRGPFRFANGIALDPTATWLYVAQSTAHNIVRIPLGERDGAIEVAYELPRGTIPDGIAFAADGSLLIGCYKPDAVLRAQPDGHVATLCEDPTGELLSRPTNVALADGALYIANLGGWHVTRVACDLEPRPLLLPPGP